MLQNLKSLIALQHNVSIQCKSQVHSMIKTLLKNCNCNFQYFMEKKEFHVYLPRMKGAGEDVRRERLASKKEQEALIKTTYNIDASYDRSLFPSQELLTQTFDGIPFSEVPIAHVKATMNNTIVSLSVKGVCKVSKSCGTEGFKNTKKGTAIAAQTVGQSFALTATKKGYKTVRTIIKGFGPGREAVLKGFELGGLNVISITDESKDITFQRPKKQKRL